MGKVLLIGWDAADWKVIHPLLDKGQMPALQSLVDQGTIGNLTTIHPVLSPMLWTSIATGKRPYKHGIHGFTEPNPTGNGIRPVTNYSRKCKAIWNMLQHHDLRSIVVGWWPSHPAEPIDGVMVSNHFHRAVGSIEQPWPIVDGSVHPPELAAKLAELRIHPSELIGDELLPFTPKVVELGQQKHPRLKGVAKTLADCATVQAVATHLIDEEPWDFMAVYFDAIDHFCHGYMRYHPPQREGIPDDEFELFKDVIVGAYRFHDMMLHSLLNSVDDDTTVILISDHGFHPDHLRPEEIPNEPAGPAIEHRDQGIFVAKGPGIAADNLIHGANIIDIAPTLLTLFNLPVGRDMDGQPLMSIFEDSSREATTIDSWENVPGECGMHPPEKQLSAIDTQQAIDQLVALGYVEKPSDNIQETVRRTVRESQFNLARAYMDAMLYAESIKILEPLWEEWPTEYRLGICLATSYQAMGQTAQQREVVEAIIERRENAAEEAKEKLRLMKEVVKQRAESESNERRDSELAEDKQETESDDLASEDLLSDAEKSEYLKLAATASFSPNVSYYLMGSVCFNEGKFEEAVEYLAKAGDSKKIAVLNLLGATYLEMEQLESARESFNKVLEKDPNDPNAFSGLARISIANGDYQQAVDQCLTAIGLQFNRPEAHFNLGVALQKMGDLDAAIDAYSTTLVLNPRSEKTHRRLAKIHERMGNEETANEHKTIADSILDGSIDQVESGSADSDSSSPGTGTVERTVDSTYAASQANTPSNEDTIIVISGLPRSGTSLLMQMLAAAGLTALVDEKRVADEDNPLGYFEYQPVRAIRDDASWMPEARGKIVKVVGPLLPFLPENESYKIIFSNRDVDEVIISQDKMMTRRGTSGPAISNDSMAQVFKSQLDKIRQALVLRSDVEILDTDFASTIEKPEQVARTISEFLGMELDVSKMAACVAPDLYRNRTNTELTDTTPSNAQPSQP